MKRSLLLIAIICILPVISACSQQEKVHDLNLNKVTMNENENSKDTPVLIGTQGVTQCSQEDIEYDDLITRSDIIAKVKILEWLGEIDEPQEKTFFKAELLNVYKGNETSNNLIRIMQEGNSKFTIKDFPLFKNGDKLILFLKKVENDDSYWVLGYDNTLYVREINDKEYAFKQFRPFTELSGIQLNKQSEKVSKDIKEIKEIFINDLSKRKEFAKEEVKAPIISIFDSSQIFESEALELKLKEKIKQKNK